jgi:hypothetical protein
MSGREVLSTTRKEELRIEREERDRAREGTD